MEGGGGGGTAPWGCRVCVGVLGEANTGPVQVNKELHGVWGVCSVGELVRGTCDYCCV